MKVKYSWSESAESWIKDAYDTNEYCERNLVVAALIALEEDDPAEAKRRLLQLVSNTTSLIDVPPHCSGEHHEN